MSDYRDPELEQMLGRMSGAYPDANTAYVAVTGRVRQVKRRRAFVASTAACVALLGVGALAVRGGSPQRVQTAAESSVDASEATVSSVSTSVEDDSTSSTELAESSSSVEETSSSVDPAVVVSAPGSSAGSSTSNKGTSTSSSNTTGSSNSGTSNITVTAPTGTTTYTSEGGTVDVATTAAGLKLVSDSPAAGFTTTVKHARPDRVEVEFSDGTITWRIRVDLVDGAPAVEVTHHG